MRPTLQRPRRRALQQTQEISAQSNSATIPGTNSSLHSSGTRSDELDHAASTQRRRRRRPTRGIWWRENRELILLGCGICIICLILLQFLGLIFLLHQELLSGEDFRDGLDWFLNWSGDSTFPEFFEQEDHLPVLVIGGTDGSGTRAFVDTIRSLGVPIVGDDPHTFDIHGSCMFAKKGWPGLISTILKETHSANYDWEDLPTTTQVIVEREVRRLLRSLNVKFFETQRRRRGVMQIPSPFDPNPRTELASNVAFAIKAPVSMLVLPVLSKFMGPIKFVHVIRDGRDIALSNNQSPVLKFYNTTYEDYETRSEKFQGDLYPVRGMQLWSDWNLQVHDYAARHNGSTAIDYLPMRSEDLLKPESKYECYQRLAQFVGSQQDSKKLCCLSQASTKDLGASTVHSETTNNFGSHPELWEKMGARKGRQRGHPIEPGAFHDDDHPLGQPRKHHRKGFPQGNVENLPGINNESVAKKESELEQWEQTLQEQQSDMQDRAVSLDEREHELLEWDASLKEREVKIRELQDQSKEAKTRRLEQVEWEPKPKNVPLQFVRTFSHWKENVMATGDKFQVETLQKMAQFGFGLKEQWQHNKDGMVGVMELSEITDVLDHIEKLLSTKGGGHSFSRTVADHDATVEANEQSVHERYGKWKAQLENRPELSDLLHKEGKRALKVFGYEPATKWSYSSSPNDEFVCDATVECHPHGTTRRRGETPSSLRKQS